MKIPVKKAAALLIVFSLFASSAVALSVEDAKDAVRDAEDAAGAARSAWQAVQPVNLFDEAERLAGLELAKGVWIKAGTVAQKKLELAKARAEENPRIASELKDEILAGTDELISKIESWKSDIAATETVADFIRELLSAKGLWREFVWKSRRYFGLAVLGNADTIAEKGRELQQALGDEIERLRDEGRDVSTLETIKANYDSDLQDVEDKLASARANIEAITEWEGSAGLYRDARSDFRDAHQAARRALQDLREARNEIIRLGVGE